MLEGDRYEVLDITTKPTSEYVGLRFRDMPIRGALIGAIVRDGRAIFPAQRRGAAGGRPGDRLHRDVAGRGRRARPVTAAQRGRIGDRRRLGIDLAGALALTGTMITYLSATAAIARSGRDRLRRGVLAVPRRRRAHRCSGLRADAARPSLARPDRLPGGVPRRLAHVAPRRRLRRAAVPLRRGAAALASRRRALRGDVGLLDHRRDRRRRRREPRPLAPALASAQPVARRNGDHRPRARRAPTAPDRRSADVRVRAARAPRSTSWPSGSGTRRAGCGSSTSR